MSFCSFCRPFALNDLDDYEKHFTVMNYDPEVVLKQVSPGGAWGAGSLWKLVQTGPHARQRVFGSAVYWSGELPCGTRVSSHRCPQRSEGHTTLSSGRDNGALRLPWFLLHGPQGGWLLLACDPAWTLCLPRAAWVPRATGHGGKASLR